MFSFPTVHALAQCFGSQISRQGSKNAPVKWRGQSSGPPQPFTGQQTTHPLRAIKFSRSRKSGSWRKTSANFVSNGSSFSPTCATSRVARGGAQAVVKAVGVGHEVASDGELIALPWVTQIMVRRANEIGRTAQKKPCSRSLHRAHPRRCDHGRRLVFGAEPCEHIGRFSQRHGADSPTHFVPAGRALRVMTKAAGLV